MTTRFVCAGALGVMLSLLQPAPGSELGAVATSEDGAAILTRNLTTSRASAAQEPLSEQDQAMASGWPLYRTDRSQRAFNAAMATLKATDGKPPSSQVFEGCANLMCPLELPGIDEEGWLPAGRFWVSASQYVLIVHSPRLEEGKAYRRRTFERMQYFILHEFENSNGNTDPYDTISSHSGSVFVPLYMSKEETDTKARHFVVVVQVAPYDVVSIHAMNHDSNGPGMEVAKNRSDELDPMQGFAGILVAALIKAKAPHLTVDNHRDSEGLPMLRIYQRRAAWLKEHPGMATRALPYVPASKERMAAAVGGLAELITRPGLAPALLAAAPPPEESEAEVPAPIAAVRPDPIARMLSAMDALTLVSPITPAARPGCDAGAASGAVGSCP